MIKTNVFSRFFLRFRYPISLPEEISEALGVNLPHDISFEEFVRQLTCPSCCPTKLSKFMPRSEAENAFLSAKCTEKFSNRTLICYHFNEGCLEFDLHFDAESRLRRLYIQHKDIHIENGYEIKLK